MSKKIIDMAYELVAEELARRDLKAGLVARATADALGDGEKGKALYIKYRAEQLCEEIEKRLRDEEQLRQEQALQEQRRQEQAQQDRRRQELEDQEREERQALALEPATAMGYIGYACMCLSLILLALLIGYAFLFSPVQTR